MEIVIELAGWLGAAGILLAYFLNSLGMVEAGRSYQMLNLLGAAGVVWNSVYHAAWPSVALNGIWVGIALASLLAAHRRVAGSEKHRVPRAEHPGRNAPTANQVGFEAGPVSRRPEGDGKARKRGIEAYLESVDRSAIMPGAGPFFYERGDVGCLLLHGWGGSCDAFRYVGPRLAEKGITVYCPLLPGHGTSPLAMAGTSARDWVAAATQHLQMLAERCRATFVAGLSMGGMITMYLGATQGHLLRGIVPINGGVTFFCSPSTYLAFQEDAATMLPSSGIPGTKDPSVVSVGYQERPANASLNVLALAKATEELLPRVIVPTLILQSIMDETMPPKNAFLFYEEIRSADKRIKWLTNSYHAATLDYDKDIIVDELVGFMRSRA